MINCSNMASSLQRFNSISSRVVTRYYGIVGCRLYSPVYLHRKSLHCVQRKMIEASEHRNYNPFFRYSTVPRTVHKPLPLNDFVSFIYSALDEFEGPCYRWVNRVEGSKHDLKKDGIFLICVAQFDGGYSVSECNSLTAFEKVKLLNQRHPSLHVMGFQYHPSILSEVVSTNLIRRIMMDYITFPIIFSNKDCFERKDEPCYILFKGLQSPSVYHDKDVDLGTLDKAVKTLFAEDGKGRSLVDKFESRWMNPVHIAKEPYLSSFLRNLLFCFPAFISSDEEGGRLFLSDVNHHRIIIFDNNGKILDCIGSSPGFEDAEFENAKLMRPAASFYHTLEDSLYFVDSENHAIRKADLEKRIVETIYPSNTLRKDTSLWSWILDKLWRKKETEIKLDELDSDSFLFPWHLLKSTNDELFVLSRSLGTLWIIDMTSGDVRAVKGLPNILEICGHMIIEKSSLVKQIPNDRLKLQQHKDETSLLEDEIPYAKLMSSVTKLKDDTVLCDAGGQNQIVSKLDTRSGSLSNFQFSNLGVLGLPYWLSFPLERVYAIDGMVSEIHTDHMEHFRLLPGRVKIKLNIEIPEHLVLVEPLEESSVWCQVRGSAIDASIIESKASSSVKVGIAQQWYDEMDNLAFSTSESESSTDSYSEEASTVEMQEGRICINNIINTSPGTSEAIIYAPIYLRLKKSTESEAKYAKKLVDIIDHGRRNKPWKDIFGKFLMETNKDLKGIIFMKPLHVRLKFDCGMHPKAESSKSVFLTDSSLLVNVLLQ